MLVGKTQYGLSARKKTYDELSSNRVPLSTPFSTNKQFNRDINERPFKYNSSEFQFKGLSFLGNEIKSEDKKDKKKKNIFKSNPALILIAGLAVKGVMLRFLPQYKKAGKYSISEFKKFSNEHLGNIGEDLLENLKTSKFAKKMIEIDGDTIQFKKKTFSNLVWDGLKYPFTILPADILNGVVGGLRKIKPLKNWADKKYNSDFFKNIRQRSKIDSKVNALRGLFQKQAELTGNLDPFTKKLMLDQTITSVNGKAVEKVNKTAQEISDEMYVASVKMFDPKTGNYDTKHERALNRLVTGLPPAIFLANDAYNLSRMMDDDSKAADKEKKIRFKQETSRILTSGYLTLITMGALQKFINNSKFGIMLMTGATVLATEMFSRLSNGKHIIRLTPEQARKENETNHSEEAKIKPVNFTSEAKGVKDKDEEADEKTKIQKPLLSFSTIMRASGIVIVAGFAMKGLRKFKSIDNVINNFKAPFKNLYKKLTVNPNYVIPVDKFNKIVKTLEDNGFKDLALKYKEVAKTATSGNVINLGEKDKKIKPLVKFIVAPFKFVWNTVTLPYWILERKLLPVIIKGYNSKKVSNVDKNIAALAKSIDTIGQQALKKDFNPKQFQDYVRDNILKAFNVDTMSNVSNSELSNLAKFSATAATLWFLMTDNYNMVMLKSNGNDVEGAKTKFKERFVQEGSRLFYQTLLIDLFNSTFSKQYNKSLLGMSWISITNTTLGEILTRKSIGTPIKPHTKKELEDIETAQNNSTGLKRGYYTFMKRLTGKRPIQSYNVANKSTSENKTIDKKPTLKSQQTQVTFANDKNIFKQIIKG